MFKKIINYYSLVIAGLLFVVGSYAQVSPDADYHSLGDIANISSGSNVCPSVAASPSTSTFKVLANTSHAGNPADFEFEWVVYGGTIISYRGTSSLGVNNQFVDDTTFSQVRLQGVHNDSSIIVVLWDVFDISQTWVAVRQYSEWGCTDEKWSVFTQQLLNEPPEFIAANFPPDINIPFNLQSAFTLVVPTVQWNDPCFTDLQTLTWSVENPLGTSIDFGDNTATTVDLQVGTNYVIWSAFDGLHTAIDTQLIVVEPQLEILNVAWTSAICDANNGTAMVTNITTLPVNASRSVEYNFNSAGWVASASAGSLPATLPQTVQARLVYLVDTDNNGLPETLYQESPVYTFTLSAMAANAVDAIPPEGPNAVVVPTSCLNTSDGQVFITETAMIPQNSSVSFDGASNYLMLNKKYEAGPGIPLTAFTVAAWIKTSASSGTIISFDNSVYYNLGLSTGRIQLQTRSASNNINTVTVDNVNFLVNDGLWHLVVATYNSVDYNIYIDGELAKTQAANGDPNIGNGSVRYGMIGALSTASVFGAAPLGFYFNGQIAEVGVWDNISVDASLIVPMFTGGMSSLGTMTDHWVLNNVPANVSATSPDVFTDLGNDVSSQNWARFYNAPLSPVANDAPYLFSWSDDASVINIDRENGLSAETTYSLTVKDIFGCGDQIQDYFVPNGDSNDPLALWNVAIAKNAAQSDGDTDDAALAADGMFNTLATVPSEINPWWEVSLGGNYPVRMVKITANVALSNAYIILSPSQLPDSDLPADLATPGIYTQQFSLNAGDTYVATMNVQTRYVRIRANQETALDLYEVEVLTSYPDADLRTLYITDNCEYQIIGNDATIDPVPFDACGALPTIQGVSPGINGGAPFNSLIGFDLPIGLYTVTWTVTDENANTSTLDVTYDVVEEEPPVFEAPPFDGVPNHFTFCDAQTYQFPIPSVTDNYHHCVPMRSITLYRNGWLAYSYPTVDLQNYTYDYTAPGLTNPIPSQMQPGTHEFEWRVIDDAGNQISTTHTIYIEVKPLLREVRIAKSCNSAAAYNVFFANYDADPSAAEVIHILRPVLGGPDITSTSPVINNIPAGTYKAYISVNGCVSNEYPGGDIVISEPDAIALNPSITNVQCFGETNGAISLSPTGGSQTNVLHLYTDGQISVPNYAALDLNDTLLIECWVFLDSLANGGMNWNADIFGVGNSYGFRMLNGQLAFYAGSATPATAALPQRTWTHIAGYFTWNGSDDCDLTLYINGAEAATELNQNIDPALAAGQNIFIGNNGNGFLNGFVRNARVWSNMPATFNENIVLANPINNEAYLLANFPVNETGGATVYNQTIVSGALNGTITGSATNQRFAFYWLDSDGNFISFNREILNRATGTYHVWLFDPLGCEFDDVVPIAMDDDDPPSMTFYSDRERTSSPLGVGEPIVRYTDDVSGGGNVDTDCYYFPYNWEFDPIVDDGDCPASAVTLSYQLISSTGGWGVPPPTGDPAADSTLNGIGMTGIITLEWTATDPNGAPATRQVSYYTVDNQPPLALTRPDSIVNTDNLACDYTVQAGQLLPALNDNCSNRTPLPGRLYNNLNNSNSLAGWVFAPGDHTITWTYEDQTFPDELAPGEVQQSFVLHVNDNQLPQAACVGALTVQLNSSGTANIDYLDIDNGSTDNCGTLAAMHITRNVAYGLGSASQSPSDNGTCFLSDAENANAALDGNISNLPADCSSTLTNSVANPFWRVNLGVAHTLYGINVYEGTTPVSGFWVLVSNNGIFANNGDWTEAGADFESTDVIYHEYFSGTLSGYQFFSFPTAIENATHVQIIVNGTAQLSLAEVEVFGSTSPSGNLTLNCDDVRYTPAPDTGTPGVWDDAQGTFGAMRVLLTAIDDDGNTGSCATEVTVQDFVQPMVIPLNATVYLDNNGDIDLNNLVDDIDDGSSDACGIAERWIIPNTLTCLNTGNNNIRFYARDIYGNTAYRNAVIVLADSTRPVLNIQENIRLSLGDDGTFTIDPRVHFDNGTIDNCTAADQLVFEVTPEVLTCDDIGYIDIDFVVRDLSGNEATRTVNILVADDDGPTAVLNTHTLVINSDSYGVITFEDLIPYASIQDNCTDDFTNNRFISYNVSGNWCAAGNEGSSAPSAFTNISNLASVSGSTNYSSFSRDNVIDNNLSTAFVSNDITGERELILTFPQQYEFNRADVRWHEEDFTPAPTLISVTQSPTVTGSPAYPGYPLSNCNSNTISDDYITNDAGSSYYIQYQFSQMFTLTNTRVYWWDWGNNTDPPTSADLDYWDGDSWESLGSISRNNGWNSLDFGDVYTDRIRLNFTENNRRVAVSEWEVYGFAGPLQYDCELPNGSTRLQWDNAGVWTDVSPASGYTNIGLLANDDNRLNFSSTIQTDRFRLLMYGDNQRVGVQELRLFGREISAGNACISFSCADVGTDIPVFLRIVDDQGTYTDYETTVPVEPYFDILEILIKDCGVTGERYYPVIENLSSSRTYTYTWDEDNDHGQSLFEYTNCNNIPDSNLPYSGYPDNWAILQCGSDPATHTDYRITLDVADENGCSDDFLYEFEYDGVNTTATSIKPWEACLGETMRFEVIFPRKFTFWRRDYMQYRWINIDTGLLDIVSGGNSRGGTRSIDDECNGYWWWGSYYPVSQTVPQVGQNGDPFIEVTFNVSTAANGGATTNIRYEYIGSEYTGTPPSQIYYGTGSYVSGNTYLILDSLATGGPYLIENEPTNGRTIAAEQPYIFGSCTFFNDYGMCSEVLEYQVTVYDVADPVLQAFDAYNTNTWIDANLLDVCVGDTIWYRVENYDDDYVRFVWDGYTMGTRIAQGNWNDDSIRIIWNQFPAIPSLSVTGYNELDCSSDPTVVTHTFTDNEAPVLGNSGDCSALNVIGFNTPGQCQFTFQNLPPPLMTDNCRNRIASYYNDFNNGKNAAGIYPVGTTTVTWYASDYSTNEGSCSHTITVLDNEAPQLDRIPVDITVYSAADACTHTFSGVTHDVVADDNCDSRDAFAAANTFANIYRFNSLSGLYDLQDMSQVNLTTLNGAIFEPGISRVEWTTTDGVDNSAYGAYDPNGNITTVDFYITVEDNILPVIDQNPGTPEIDPLTEITGVNDANECFATITVPYPGYDGSGDLTDPDNVLFDNCTPDADLNVVFVSRSDGGDEADPYPVGTTTITWRVSDQAGNYTQATQDVTISDTQEPWFDAFSSDPVSISYCAAQAGYSLPIPSPNDNCGMLNVFSISYNVTGGKGLNYTGTINQENGAFNPRGNGLTYVIPDFFANVYTFAEDPAGTDFTVTWTALDVYGNATTVSYTYQLHVEIEPVFGTLNINEMTCGGADDASISINISANAPDYHYDRNYPVYFSVYNGVTWGTPDQTLFGGLRGGDYIVRMRVNNCVSAISQTVTITEPTPYTLSIAQIDEVVCPEDETGSIALSMGGGAPGQLHFAGTGFAALDYNEIDLGASGSMAARVYFDDLNDNGLIDAAENGTLFTKGNDAYSLSVNNGELELTVGNATLTTTGAGIVPDKWYYIVATWNSGTGAIYIDGAPQATSGAVAASALTNATSFSMGDFNGILRDVSVWNTTLDGSVPLAPYTGKETDIVGYWQLNDGAGASAYNSCKTNSIGTNATGNSALWISTMPQPGVYTWYKNNAWYSNDINIEDLGIGNYKVQFVDPYNCPNPLTDPLLDSLLVIPTDREAPAITAIGNLVVQTDQDVCYYFVDDLTEAQSLTPAITDASACLFDINWRVVTDYNLNVFTYTDADCNVDNNSWNRILNATLGRSGTNGLNTVTVTTLQNEDVSSTYTYTITVQDDQNPIADGRFEEGISLDLDENGLVSYNARDFNENSSDNCTPPEDLIYELYNGTEWRTSIDYDCTVIGEEVSVRFRVTDEAGLRHEDAGVANLQVRDVTPPVITETANQPIGPYCATNDAGTFAPGAPAYTEIPLSAFEFMGYTDNCGVTRIRYKREHTTWSGDNDATFVEITDMIFDPNVYLRFFEGETVLSFELADGSEAHVALGLPRNTSEKDIFVVTVLPKPTIDPNGIE